MCVSAHSGRAAVAGLPDWRTPLRGHLTIDRDQRTVQAPRRNCENTGENMRSQLFLPLALAIFAGCAEIGSSGSTDVADTSATDSTVSACSMDAGVIAYDAKIVADPQYALDFRAPALGATVCNGVIHSWAAKAQGVPKFTWVLGPRHTAGGWPVQSIYKSSSDAGRFVVQEPFFWSGPGTHVHFLAENDSGAIVLDPFFEYDIVHAGK